MRTTTHLNWGGPDMILLMLMLFFFFSFSPLRCMNLMLVQYSFFHLKCMTVTMIRSFGRHNTHTDNKQGNFIGVCWSTFGHASAIISGREHHHHHSKLIGSFLTHPQIRKSKTAPAKPDVCHVHSPRSIFCSTFYYTVLCWPAGSRFHALMTLGKSCSTYCY